MKKIYLRYQGNRNGFLKRLKLIAPVANNFLKDYVLIFRKLVCPLKTRRHSGVFMKQTVSWYRRLKF